ncbi:MAG: VWA domain-containing protein [Phycisphaerae bacterium]|nr:VWA domain-containing protein [Phycisphaerae bacterium]
MNRENPRVALIGLLCLAFLAGSADAQITGTLTPDNINNVQAAGTTQTYTLNYEVTVPNTPTGEVDVMFLTDSTASMGGYIKGMQTAFSRIVTGIARELPAMDVRYGVADYRDYRDGDPYSTTGVNLRQGFTSDAASVQRAIDSLSPGGGGDTPEEQLKSMQTLANEWLSAEYGGRPDAQKLLIWGGDAPGHYFGKSPADGPPDWYPSLTETIASLNSQGIKVFGLNVGSDNAGIDDLSYGQQEDNITSATGGTSFYKIGSGNNTIEEVIVGAITAGATTLTNITLKLAPDDGDFTVTPWTDPRIGSWRDTTVSGEFSFDATAPLGAGIADFDYVLLGNGAELARSHICLTACPLQGYTLSISSTEGGSVIEPGQGDFPGYCHESVPIKARAETCYKFKEWTGTAVDANKVEAPKEPETTVFVDADYTLIANFELDPNLYLLEISSTEGGSVVEPGEGTFPYLCNPRVPIEAQPDICYEFTGWTGTAVTNNRVEGPNDPKTTVIVDANYTLIANFAFENLPIILPSEGGTVVIVDIRPWNGCERLVTVEARRDPCYEFISWRGSAVDVGKVAEDAPARTGFLADRKYTLQAHFEPTMIEDDFESYNDIDPNEPGSNRIFDVWVDGYGDDTNGALVGNLYAPYAEQHIVHGGRQSMPYSYDNDMKISTATKTVDCPCDWTEAGVATLSVWFRGDPTNLPELMFVAVNGDAVVYHDNPAATRIAVWTEWSIDLQAFADQGADLRNVDTITIGFGVKNAPTAGGQGKVYFDDIRLLRPAQEP